jgi:hypothetical protein
MRSLLTVEIGLHLPGSQLARVVQIVRAAQFEVAVDELVTEAHAHGTRAIEIVERGREIDRQRRRGPDGLGDDLVGHVVHVPVARWQRKATFLESVKAGGADGCRQ